MKTSICIFSMLIIFTGYTQNVGIGTNSPNPDAFVHIDLGNSSTKGFLVSGTINESASVPNLGIGSRMMFYPGKAAFRAGYAEDHWNNISVGRASTAMGWNTTASGEYSFAMGFRSIASGTYSTGLGNFGYATGTSSFSVGDHSNATGEHSIAIGRNVYASGGYSTAIGFNCFATASNSFVAGSLSRAEGNGAVALGDENKALGDNSLATGWRTIARANWSSTFGSNTIAKNFASTVLGRYNDTSNGNTVFVVGNGSSDVNRSNALVVQNNGNVGIGTNFPRSSALLHVELLNSTTKGFLVSGEQNGSSTVEDLPAGARMTFYPGKTAFRVGYVSGTQWNNSNTGRFSMAMGYSTIASGLNSTAMGAESVASGDFSTAIGGSTQAQGYSSLAVGIFNDPILINNEVAPTETTPLFIIGNGNSNADRKNAMVVRKDGNVGIGTSTPVHALDIKTNSSFNGKAQLRLHEDAVDFARMKFTNTAASTYWDLAGHPNTTNAGASFNIYYSGLGDVISFKGNGNATLAGTLTQNSDARLKSNIHAIPHALPLLLQLSGYHYNWSNPAKDQSMQSGLLAQEVQKLMPELVVKDDNEMLSVNYMGLIPYLIQGMKDQQVEIEALKKLVQDLLANK